MEAGKFMVMQSGFVTQREDILTLPPVDDNVTRDYVFNKDYLRDKNVFFYAKKVSELFERMYKNPKLIENDFEFREEIIRAAYSHFAVEKIEDWLHQQSGQQFFSALHCEFVEETLKFIAGQDRKAHVFQWINLLAAGDRNAVPVNFPFITFFGRYEPGRQQFNPEVYVAQDMVRLLRNWLSRPGGYQDLLITLYVIFGRRQGIRDVADRFGH